MAPIDGELPGSPFACLGSNLRTLALDLSTKTGWSLFIDAELTASGGTGHVPVEGFNVNADPHLNPLYPYNVVDAAEKVVDLSMVLIAEHKPDIVVVENTVKGRNRHTQRILEFIHSAFLRRVRGVVPMVYMDVSEWRKLVELRLSKDDKKNNRDVSAGKKRGRVTRKHLSVRMVNQRFGMKLKIKDNDQADAILMGLAYATEKLP